jgi:hypothetical protein
MEGSNRISFEITPNILIIKGVSQFESFDPIDDLMFTPLHAPDRLDSEPDSIDVEYFNADGTKWKGAVADIDEIQIKLDVYHSQNTRKFIVQDALEHLCDEVFGVFDGE